MKQDHCVGTVIFAKQGKVDEPINNPCLFETRNMCLMRKLFSDEEFVVKYGGISNEKEGFSFGL